MSSTCLHVWPLGVMMVRNDSSEKFGIVGTYTLPLKCYDIRYNYVMPVFLRNTPPKVLTNQLLKLHPEFQIFGAVFNKCRYCEYMSEQRGYSTVTLCIDTSMIIENSGRRGNK